MELFGQSKKQNNVSLFPRTGSNSYFCLVVIGVLVLVSVAIAAVLVSVVLNWEENRNGTCLFWNKSHLELGSLNPKKCYLIEWNTLKCRIVVNVHLLILGISSCLLNLILYCTFIN